MLVAELLVKVLDFTIFFALVFGNRYAKAQGKSATGPWRCSGKADVANVERQASCNQTGVVAPEEMRPRIRTEEDIDGNDRGERKETISILT